LLPGRLPGASGYLGGEDYIGGDFFMGYKNIAAYDTRKLTSDIFLRDYDSVCNDCWSYW